MLHSANDVDDGAVLETDLCIAGAGATGITLALRFAGTPTGVVLLEGGGEGRAPGSQALYAGTCEAPLDDSYLSASRLRLLGGTTNHWIGACLALDPIDMEARDWVPDSGWPIQRGELDPYYHRACGVLGIEPFHLGEDLPLYDGSTSVLKYLRVRPTRFGIEHRPALETAANLRLVLEANVIRVALADGGERVDRLEVAAVGERRFAVRARHFVLALGGIENSRMLLISDDVQAGGVGNRHDLVGRYFMDHPDFPIAEVCISDRDLSLKKNPRYETHGHRNFRLSEGLQRRHRLLNCMMSIGGVPQVEDTRHALLRDGAWQRLKPYLEEQGGFPRSSALGRLGRTFAGEDRLHHRRFSLRPESPPVRDSRVTLSERVDPYGNRRTHLSWQPPSQVYDTVKRTVELFAVEVGRRGLGRVRLDLEALERETWSPGFHHMGGTRMHDDPRHGVVDRQCRVHGVANLFIAGSSVFPAAGYANPTYTIVALALRLAEHLERKLGRPA